MTQVVVEDTVRASREAVFDGNTDHSGYENLNDRIRTAGLEQEGDADAQRPRRDPEAALPWRTCARAGDSV